VKRKYFELDMQEYKTTIEFMVRGRLFVFDIGVWPKMLELDITPLFERDPDEAEWVAEQELSWSTWVFKQSVPFPDSERRYTLGTDWAFAQLVYFGKVRWWPEGTSEDAKSAIDPHGSESILYYPWDLSTQSRKTAISIGVSSNSLVKRVGERNIAVADFGSTHNTRWQIGGPIFHLEGWETTWGRNLSEAVASE
jgi:hypothetical protein